MSGKISGLVWELDVPPNEKYVLEAYADHADHNGENVRPGNHLIAWKTGYDERNVRRITKSLRDRGILIPTKHSKGGRGKATEYKIVFPPHLMRTYENPDTDVTVSESNPDAHAPLSENPDSSAPLSEENRGQDVPLFQKGGHQRPKRGTNSTLNPGLGVPPTIEPSGTSPHRERFPDGCLSVRGSPSPSPELSGGLAQATPNPPDESVDEVAKEELAKIRELLDMRSGSMKSRRGLEERRAFLLSQIKQLIEDDQ